MLFWRKKKNQAEQEQEQRDEKLLHPPQEPDLELPTEHESKLDESSARTLKESEDNICGSLSEEPVQTHTPVDDAKEAAELSDHTEEGGWLSRLTEGLSKSSAKLSDNLTSFITKKKLDQDTLNDLEDALLEADLGPKTASRIIESFALGRFGKDIDEQEIRETLAEQMSSILEHVAKPLIVEKPDQGPFVILVCGVNGAGKTTTIGKMAHKLKYEQKAKVMLAAGDTFRAAAVEQLSEWGKRVGCGFVAKDIGADAASVAYEAYNHAVAEGADVLFIDTAGRLQNKKNLMEELDKIIRVLKKHDESIPHATLLVLDSTTGQNAFSQVEAFQAMTNVSGLIVTKLDGSAKGGVLVGLADQFELPVHFVGIGEQIEDLQPFSAGSYARSLVGL